MMTTEDDPSLIREYQATQSEAAFRTVVDRHLRMVYGLALRRTGSREAAEEVAQNVFIVLARKIHGGFRAKGPLNGWLYQTTLYQSSRWLRTDRRRKLAMERYRASQQSASAEEELDTLDPGVRSELEEAIGQLAASDRSLVIQRYLEGRTFREIGEILGRSEDAARKRVAVAVEKLARHFRPRGRAVSTTTVSAVLGTMLVGDVPTGLASSVTRFALQSASSGSTAGAIIGSKAFVAVSAAMAFIVPVAVEWQADISRGEAAIWNTGPLHGAGRAPQVQDEDSASVDGRTRVSPTVAETLRALADHPSPAHAEAAVAGFLASLSHDQLRDAMEALPLLSHSGARIVIGRALFTRWASIDPDEAMKMLSSLEDPSYRRGASWGAMHCWARTDPAAAGTYLAELPEDQSSSKLLVEAYWNGFAASDPAAAVDRADGLKDSAERLRALQFVFGEWNRNAPLEALAHLEKMEDDAQRDQRMEAALRSHSRRDAREAVEIGRQLLSEGAPAGILTDPLTDWSRKEPVAAFAAAAALPKDPEIDNAISRMAASIRSWAVAEEVAATVPDSIREIFVSGLARGSNWGSWEETPEAYHAIAELLPTIADGKRRQEAAYDLREGWARHAKSEADAWLTEFLQWHRSESRSF